MLNLDKKVKLLRKLYFQGDVSFAEFVQILSVNKSQAEELIGDLKKDIFLETTLKDAVLIKPRVFSDRRGFFLEAYSEAKFVEAGVGVRFVQDNHSMSAEKGVLRGFHFQRPPYAQSKLVRVLKGSVYDVIVDMRKNSPTFGNWEGFRLTDDNKLMLFIPRGFAHAFCTLEPNTEFFYKVDSLYAPDHDDGFMWNDSTFRIKWPVINPIMSDKDQKLGAYRDLDNPF